jgi:hypothetical protein
MKTKEGREGEGVRDVGSQLNEIYRNIRPFLYSTTVITKPTN